VLFFAILRRLSKVWALIRALETFHDGLEAFPAHQSSQT